MSPSNDHPFRVRLEGCPVCGSPNFRPARRRWWERVVLRLGRSRKRIYRCEANHRFRGSRLRFVY